MCMHAFWKYNIEPANCGIDFVEVRGVLLLKTPDTARCAPFFLRSRYQTVFWTFSGLFRILLLLDDCSSYCLSPWWEEFSLALEQLTSLEQLTCQPRQSSIIVAHVEEL